MAFPVVAETTGHCGWSWRYQHSKSGVDELVNMDNLLSRTFPSSNSSFPPSSQTQLSNSNIPIFSVLVFSTGIFSLVGTTVFAATVEESSCWAEGKWRVRGKNLSLKDLACSQVGCVSQLLHLTGLLPPQFFLLQKQEPPPGR